MMIVNTDFISGKTLQTLSLVRGSTVHSKNIGRDIQASRHWWEGRLSITPI